MKNNYLKEVIVSLALVVVATLLVNPFMLWMPSALEMTVIAVFAIIFFAFASLVWKESSGDEREDLHKLMAGRIAYLTGSTVIVIGIVVEGLRHWIDPWLVTALTAMVLAKIIALVYRDRNN